MSRTKDTGLLFEMKNGYKLLVGYKETFEEIKILGKGGFGEVVMVKNKYNGKTYALKKLLKYDSQIIEMEVTPLIELSYSPKCDPNYVCYYDSFYFMDNNILKYGILMEYVDGLTLDKFFKDLKIMNPGNFYRTVLIVAREMTKAIARLHSIGYVHRDIKTINAMITKGGTLKILDFGLACQNSSFRKTGSCYGSAGTPGYLSPEFYVNNQNYGLDVYMKSDVYSIGVTLYVLLHDSYPYKFGPGRLPIDQFIGLKTPYPCLDDTIKKMVTYNYNYRISSAEANAELNKCEIPGVPIKSYAGDLVYDESNLLSVINFNTVFTYVDIKTSNPNIDETVTGYPYSDIHGVKYFIKFFTGDQKDLFDALYYINSKYVMNGPDDHVIYLANYFQTSSNKIENTTNKELIVNTNLIFNTMVFPYYDLMPFRDYRAASDNLNQKAAKCVAAGLLMFYVTDILYKKNILYLVQEKDIFYDNENKSLKMFLNQTNYCLSKVCSADKIIEYKENMLTFIYKLFVSSNPFEIDAFGNRDYVQIVLPGHEKLAGVINSFARILLSSQNFAPSFFFNQLNNLYLKDYSQF